MYISPDFKIAILVFADDEALDLAEVEKIFALGGTQEDVRSIESDAEHDVALIVFGRDVVTPPGVRGDEPDEFQGAVSWLRRHSPDQFQRVTGLGLGCTLIIEGFSGVVPSGLLEQLRRLGLSLSIASYRRPP